MKILLNFILMFYFAAAAFLKHCVVSVLISRANVAMAENGRSMIETNTKNG